MATAQMQLTQIHTRQVQTREQNEWLPAFTPSADILKRANPQNADAPGYYGIPMLKRPTWEWHIAVYFLLEGISSGAALIASVADVFGDERYRGLVRTGHYVSFATLLPCPPLLIADLGRPDKFYHMLRIFKPTSPMNLGAWALTTYAPPVGLLAARQLAEDLALRRPALKRFARLVPRRLLSVGGVPAAATMASYPGVLLSTTSNPLWSQSRWLGALFAASSLNTGAAAISLVLALSEGDNRLALDRLHKIERLASVCEGAALAGYLVTTGKAAKPLLKGRHGWQLMLGAVGIGLVLPQLIPTRPGKRRQKGLFFSLLRSGLELAGGLALKWAITHAGRTSALDAEAAHEAARPSASAPGWSRNGNERVG